MQLRELAYQQRVLGLLDTYLDELCRQRNKANKIAHANAKQSDPDLKLPPLNFPQRTWEELKDKNCLPVSRANIPYSERWDGAKRAVPNVVYKVPTAGGKTFLAVESLSKIFNQYLGQRTGFVLWIVPNEAIYTQTKKNLADRRHPYRQLLDNLSGNALKLMEKNTPFNAADVDSNLCVMLLMLQSSNRENKKTLKMFQERGDVHGFSPEEGNQLAHQQMLKESPNLDTCDLADSAYAWKPIKDSLGNALRMIRPVVVMDEGHKAVAELAFRTLYDFNPCFVLELTATPKDVLPRAGKKPQAARYQNILAEVSGVALDREGMIKMPLNLDSRQSIDWKTTLQASLARLNALDACAKSLHANQNRYLRPIMLVQVERTGANQRGGGHVHAEDVKAWLTSGGRLHADEVAIKTAKQNDLKLPQNQDLLSAANRVRVIITKKALQEGWDCPFAYVLCCLAVSANQAAMTQLIGRILRQPQADKTGVAELDQCYVVTHHSETNAVVDQIKRGLEQEGMGDLVQSIHVGDPQQPNRRAINRNPKFASAQIFLPKVLRVTEHETRELDYEEDILYALDWGDLEVAELVERIPKNYQAAERQLRKIWLEDSAAQPSAVKNKTTQSHSSPPEPPAFDCAYATQFIADIVTNPWRAREIVGAVVRALQARGIAEAELAKLGGYILEALRKWLLEQRDARAEKRFREQVQAGCIQFHLRSDADFQRAHWQMPSQTQTTQRQGATCLVGAHGGALQKSLFQPIYQADLNEDERTVAVYMDGAETLKWWHRNVSRHQYYLQGWRRDKIYPDFICARQTDAYGVQKLMVLEMKGDHLAGNKDTNYKKAMLNLLTDTFVETHADRIGEADLVGNDGTEVHCDLVLFSNWKERLPRLLAAR